MRRDQADGAHPGRRLVELSKHGATDEYGRLSIESDESAIPFDPEDSLGLVSSSGYHINTEFSPLPAAYHDGYAKADLGLKANAPEGVWTALLLVRNLTDERTYSLVDASNVYAYYVGEGSAFGFGDPGRVVSIKLHYRL